MLSFFVVACSKLSINSLCDMVAPELAGSSTWQCLYVAFFRNWVFRNSSTSSQLLWVLTLVIWLPRWSWPFYYFHCHSCSCCCFCWWFFLPALRKLVAWVCNVWLDGSLSNNWHNWFYPAANKNRSVFAVAEPVEVHVHCFGCSWYYFICDDMISSRVVCLDWHWRQWVSHFG